MLLVFKSLALTFAPKPNWLFNPFTIDNFHGSWVACVIYSFISILFWQGNRKEAIENIYQMGEGVSEKPI
jgi:hypothetical protein